MGIQHNIPIDHSARQVKEADFTGFQYILAADESNLRNLMAMKPREGTATVRLWGSYLDNKPIPDPYYGDTVRFFVVTQDEGSRIRCHRRDLSDVWNNVQNFRMLSSTRLSVKTDNAQMSISSVSAE